MAELLTPAEAATLLGGVVKPATLLEWARAGRIGSVKIGRERRFTPEHVEAYLAAHSTTASEYGRSTHSRRGRRGRKAAAR